MVNHQQMMQRVQETCFALHETMLYLDSYPSCPQALQYFRQAKLECDQAKNDYQHYFGPLSAEQSNNDTYWNWVATPWPWEMEE